MDPDKRTAETTKGTPHDPVVETGEPAEATHGAEDETWSTTGADSRHLDERIRTLEAEVERLGDELATARESARSADEKRLRALADYDNLQRRVAEERVEEERRAAARILERFLEPVEVLERAVAATEATGKADPKGLRMALERFENALRSAGLEPVPGVGAPFDPRCHQAVVREPSEQPEGVVIDIIRQGYTIGGKLLREALVKVSAGSEGATQGEA
ncbi:MAG: nucleotide exchange factor GrpE [Euryarchaeota archaeon]|nr:nucleotide exchange factor GrpE [Euryarchaeota archaeon]